MCTMLYEYNALSDLELSCELYWIVESREPCSANEKSKGTYFLIKMVKSTDCSSFKDSLCG